MSIWCSIHDEAEDVVDLRPVERDNYTGEPEDGGASFFIDVATNHSFNDCTRLVIVRYAGADRREFLLMLTPQEVERLIARLTIARADA